jgi:hypothetical protein
MVWHHQVSMSDDDWRGFAKSLGVFLNGLAIPVHNERGEPVTDDSFYLMFNAHHEPLEFTLPEQKWGEQWMVILDTAEEKDLLAEQEEGPEISAGGRVKVQPWSLVLLKRSTSSKRGLEQGWTKSRSFPAATPGRAQVDARPADHHLRRLDDRQRFIPPRQFQLVDGIAGDDRGEALISDTEAHLREEAVDADFVDDAAELSAPAQRDDRASGPARLRQRPPGPGEEAVDLAGRNAVMSTGCRPGADGALVDPLLERRVAHSQPVGGGPRRHQIHVPQESTEFVHKSILNV